MQLCYLRYNKKDYTPTSNMIKASAEARAKSKSEYIEMRGTYEYNNLLLHYTFDEIRLEDCTVLVEHKKYLDLKWYKYNAIAQVALYTSLALLNESKHYITAKFLKEKRKSLLITNKIKSILIFGDTEYNVEILNPEKVIEFYITKLYSTFSYNSAKAWDSKWKYKETKHIRQYVKI